MSINLYNEKLKNCVINFEKQHGNIVDFCHKLTHEKKLHNMITREDFVNNFSLLKNVYDELAILTNIDLIDFEVFENS